LIPITILIPKMGIVNNQSPLAQPIFQKQVIKLWVLQREGEGEGQRVQVGPYSLDYLTYI
jgi:hypothetical protein